MTILQSLNRAYDRLALRHEVPSFGFSSEKISFCLSLNADGTLAGPPIDLRETSGKKPAPRMMAVPQPYKRTSGVKPNFLWDKTSYVLGITAAEGKRLAEEHKAFKDFHLGPLRSSDDEGLIALARFLESWSPESFSSLSWPDEVKTVILDQNIVFALESERRDGYLHDRPAAKRLWAGVASDSEGGKAICLVSGEEAPIARLHPSIKGVWGGQVAGGSIVSFNLDAFTSYGHEQGDNAPVSEAAAFGYTTALNKFLEKGSANRIQIGDASTVFWADASDADAAGQAEAVFANWWDDQTVDEAAETKNAIRPILEKIRAGQPLAKFALNLSKGVRFHVLGLAPNAARISIRFWYDNDFAQLVENYQAYVKDINLEQRSNDRPPLTISRCVLRTAPARRDRTGKISYDREQISPLLSGELLRAILTGGRFPSGLLSHLLMRIRSDHVLDSVRVALIKALLVRDMRLSGLLPESTDGKPKEEYLMRSQPDDPNPARRLGRLFALIERAQLAALGDEINATVKDKFLGAAAATPSAIFTGILKNAQHHLKRLRNGHSDAKWIKDAALARRVAAALDRDIGRLWATFNDGLAEQHSNEEQGLFFVGYYQERFGGKDDTESGSGPEAETDAILTDKE
ncbi:MAG TPA: type I-C CRISPR-associated protein Cas8c/Csd1 [Asticcacaulis sp.]|nr:type I-C CRISPR-associated protein Cas8c/Csd1 [Asticcacaulis sp.]